MSFVGNPSRRLPNIAFEKLLIFRRFIIPFSILATSSFPLSPP